MKNEAQSLRSKQDKGMDGTTRIRLCRNITFLERSPRDQHAKYGTPIIVALPDKAWKWCYIDKLYG